MAGASVIDDYVADLDSRLRGDDRAKADLLTEARDSLRDAAECYQDAGFGEAEAQRRAVDDFGPVATMARGYQGELAVAYGARTLRTILFTLPVVNLIWETTRLFWIGSWESFAGPPPPAWYIPFTQINDSMTWAVAVAAAFGLLIARIMARRVNDSRLIARCAAGIALVAVTASVAASVALFVATVAFDPSRLFLSPALFVVSVLVILVLSRLAVMAKRTVGFAV